MRPRKEDREADGSQLNTPSEYSRGRDAWKPFFGPTCDTILHDLSIVERGSYEQSADERGEGQEGVESCNARGSNRQQGRCRHGREAERIGPLMFSLFLGAPKPKFPSIQPGQPGPQDLIMIPITVFTGFLGAGKTSIILSLLPQLPSNYRVVLLKNEFGDIEGSFSYYVSGGRLSDLLLLQSIVNWRGRAV